MTLIERLKTLIDRDPFLPFVIRRATGESIRVTLPEQIWSPPGAPWMRVVKAESEREDSEIRIDFSTISDVVDEGRSEQAGADMTTEKFDELLKRRPFDPFTIYLADGGSIVVKSPEFASRTQQGRTIIVSTGGERTEYIDLLLVTRMATGVQNGKKRSERRREPDG